jgi:hypothetical protein
MRVNHHDRIIWLLQRKPLWEALYKPKANKLMQTAVVEDVFAAMVKDGFFTEGQKEGALFLIPNLIHMAWQESLGEESVA